MKIAIDAMGGDFAPNQNINGVKLALAEIPSVDTFLLVGDTELVRGQLKTHGLSASDPRIKLVHASQVITMDDPSAAPVRTKKDSSISVSAKLLKEQKADAIVTAGHTGAAVAATVITNRMLKGIDRPGIASVFPAPKGPFVMLDIGANVDCKAIHLAQYAILGETYAEIVLHRKRPKIGVLSNGSEDKKGNDLTKESCRILQTLPINFLGNVEGADLFNNKVDVVLSDGFVGNVVLKCCESLAKAFSGMLKESLKKSPVRMAGAFLSKNAFRELKEITDHEEYGGAPLLGINGTCIIAHGNSSPKAIKNAIRVASEMIKNGYNDIIEKKIQKIDWETKDNVNK